MTDIRPLVIDLMSRDPDYYFVLTQALGDFAAGCRAEAEGGINPESQLKWAGAADAMLKAAEDAVSRQGYCPVWVVAEHHLEFGHLQIPAYAPFHADSEQAAEYMATLRDAQTAHDAPGRYVLAAVIEFGTEQAIASAVPLPDRCAYHGGEGSGHPGCPGCQEDEAATAAAGKGGEGDS